MPRGPAGPMRRWLGIARDDSAGGSHIFIVEAANIKTAYERCMALCIQQGFPKPEQRAVYEIKENKEHICTVLEPKLKEGLFNGRSNVSIGPGASNARSWAGAILR